MSLEEWGRAAAKNRPTLAIAAIVTCFTMMSMVTVSVDKYRMVMYSTNRQVEKMAQPWKKAKPKFENSNGWFMLYFIICSPFLNIGSIYRCIKYADRNLAKKATKESGITVHRFPPFPRKPNYTCMNIISVEVIIIENIDPSKASAINSSSRSICSDVRTWYARKATLCILSSSCNVS